MTEVACCSPHIVRCLQAYSHTLPHPTPLAASEHPPSSSCTPFTHDTTCRPYHLHPFTHLWQSVLAVCQHST
jgi:hypothetical protein